MEKEEIIENNKMLARFLGYEYFGFKETKRNTYNFTDEFLGWRLKDIKNVHIQLAPKDWFIGRNHHDLPFYNDWNWLMKVIDKFHYLPLEEPNYHIDIGKNHCRVIYNWDDYMQDVLSENFRFKTFDKSSKDYRYELFSKGKIEAVYTAVVELLKHYNETTKMHT